MDINHVIVFVGATPSLSSELNLLRKRLDSTIVIAPASPKGKFGLSDESFIKALAEIASYIENVDDPHQKTRLSIWFYKPSSAVFFEKAWKNFGSYAWIEQIPQDLLDKNIQTRIYIEVRTKKILQSIHEIAHQIYNNRKTSPVTLPLRNFRSKFVQKLADYWYNDKDQKALKKEIEKITQQYRSSYASEKEAFADDRKLLFKPAQDSACHGRPHPIGNTKVCYLAGRFRFGAALYPGFHYDVSQDNKNLDCVLYDCMSSPRDMRSERRAYLNIFPNDYLLPAK